MTACWNILAVSAFSVAIPLAFGQEAPQRSSVEGVILRAGAGTPVANAKITITLAPRGAVSREGPAAPAAPGRGSVPPRPIPSVVTNDKGRFAFPNLDPGTYRIQAQANGYVPQRYGQLYPGGDAPITLIAGQSKTDADITLTPAGNISGRIRDMNDQPAENVPVQLLRSSFDSQGRRRVETVGGTITSDRGEYRFYWITPGRYLLKAGIQSGLAAARVAMETGSRNGGNPNRMETDAGAAYYPGVPDPVGARTIEVFPGGDLTAIDWTVPTRPPGRRVAIRLIDTKTGQPPADADVSLRPFNPGFGRDYRDADQSIFDMQDSMGHAYSPKTGRAEFRDLPPGAYAVIATVSSFLCPDGSAPSESGEVSQRCGSDRKNGTAPIRRSSVGSIILTVGAVDLDDATLTVVPSGTLTGRLHTEDEPAPQPQEAGAGPKRRQSLQLIDISGSGLDPDRWTVSAQVGEDGSFHFDVSAGLYRLMVNGLPPDTHVQSARLDSFDILNTPMVLGETPSGTLDIVVSSKGGQVQGNLVNEKSEPVASGQVVLVPRSRGRVDLYKTTTADTDGRFKVTGIAPGDYKLFSWQGLDQFGWFDPELLERSEARGIPVHISESSTATAEVHMIPEGNGR